MATYIVDELITRLTFRRDDAALDQVQKKVQGYQRTLNGLAQKTAIAGTALTGVAAVVGRTLLGFDRSLNALAATFGNATADQLERLQAQAREFGATTSKSATDAVRAQLELARAGLDVEEVLAALPGVLNLAIAGELEMGQAASLVTNQINAFGLSATDASRVVDVLATTATNANTTVRQLQPAFRQVAPLANAMGLSIETTAAALGTLRNQGLAAEQAGTALRGILVRFADADPPASMIEGFRSLGLNFADLRAQMEQGDLVGVLRQMQAAGLDAGRATQIFGTEAVAAVLALTANAGDLQAFAGNLDNVDGAANRMRERMESGLPGAFDAFKSSAEAAQLSLGESGLGGGLESVLNLATSFMRWLVYAPGPVKAVANAVLFAGPVLLGLGIVLKGVSFALGGYVAVTRTAVFATNLFRNANLLLRIQLLLLTAQDWLAVASRVALRAVTIAGTAVTWGLVAAQWALNVAMTANPIGLIILAVVAAVAALAGLGYVIWRFRDAIVGAIGSAIDWVRDNWPLLLAIITGPFGLAIYAVWRFRDKIIGAFRSAWEWIANAASGIFDAIIWPFKQAFDYIADKWDKVKGLFGDVLGINVRTTETRDTVGAGAVPAPARPGTSAPGASPSPGAIPAFHQGGIVPGTGDQPAILQGGELVVSRAMVAMLQRLGDGAGNVAQPIIQAAQAAAAPIINVAQPVIEVTARAAAPIIQAAQPIIQPAVQAAAPIVNLLSPAAAPSAPGQLAFPDRLLDALVGLPNAMAQYGPQLAAASAGGGAAGLLPAVPPPAPTVNNVTRHFNVTVGDINFEVHTESIASEEDITELVQTVPDWMRDQLENLAADLDSDILR